jgi:hypothetical protein
VVELKGKVALEKLRQESEQLKLNLKTAEAAAKSKEREDDEARSLLESATSRKLTEELTFDSVVSPTASSLTATSSSSTEQQQPVNICCAGDFCFVSNGHKVVCGMTCRRCEKSCHYDCCVTDEYGFKICSACEKKRRINEQEQV